MEGKIEPKKNSSNSRILTEIELIIELKNSSRSRLISSVFELIILVKQDEISSKIEPKISSQDTD